MRPNVLLIVFDAARRDAFEPYGAAPGSTPALAQLAARGSALPSAYSTACWTVPSHTSLFTGLMPAAAGLGNPTSPGEAAAGVAALSDRWLPEQLRSAGYFTAAVSANAWISRASGFDAGFDSFDLVESGRQARIHQTGLLARAGWQLEAIRARVDDGAGAALDAFRRLADGAGDGDGPFFWFTNLVEAHSPYLPPLPWNSLGAADRRRAAAEAMEHLTLPAIWRGCAGDLDVPAAALERMRALLRDSVRYMDDWLGRLLEMMDERGILDDTLVIVTADHGENLGEGGLITHALSLDERLIHVPFIAAGPGAPSGDGVLSLAHVPRLIAEATGTPGPWAADELPDGLALAQQVAQLAPDDPRKEIARREWSMTDEALGRFQVPLAAATDGTWKLLSRGGDLALYDLATDLLEERPLAPADGPAEVGARLKPGLPQPAMRAAEKPAPGADDRADDAERRDIEERMRLLGYL